MQIFWNVSTKKGGETSGIKAVIDVESQKQAKLLWKNVRHKTKTLLEDAIGSVMELRPGEFPTRVFLLDELYDTRFIKDTPGGMLGSKRYFNVSHFNVEDAKELAEMLIDKNWSDLKN